jgi:serine/threonine-protein kinase
VAALASRGLGTRIVYVFSTQPANTVTAQTPAAGDRVLRGSKVRVNVSKGTKPVQVPDVTGQPYANAEGALKGAGFTVSRVDIESDAPKDEVVAVNPPAGTQIPHGSKVTLSVSKGPTASQVPDVTGQTQADAVSLVKGAGFVVAIVPQPVTDPSQDGVVISQTPTGGTSANPKEVVTLTVGRLQGGPGGDGATTGTTTTP